MRSRGSGAGHAVASAGPGVAAPAVPVANPLAARPLDLPTEVPLEPGADLSALDTAKIFAAPADPASWPQWRAQLVRWRIEARARAGVDGGQYDDPDHRWAARCWAVGMLWLWDDLLWDPAAARFTPERLLAAYERFGGLDAIVLWHAYPVIGLDPRDQFDWYDVPGLTDLVESFHRLGIRVFLDYNPWDGAAPDEAATPAPEHSERVAALVADLHADGVFLDTLREGDPTLVRRLQQLDPSPVLEGETKVSLERIEDHLLSWAQWFADSTVPGVLRAHWFEQRHMIHHTRRWNRDHGAELRSAWMNGVGVLVWEVVFGSWVGWNDRDVATLRAMRRVQRALGDHFVDGEWAPLVDAAEAATAHGVTASRFSLGDQALWTLVNRTATAYRGPVLELAEPAGSAVTGSAATDSASAGAVADADASDDADEAGRWFDVVTGQPVTVRCRRARRAPDGTRRRLVVVDAAVPAFGIGGLLRLAEPAPDLRADAGAGTVERPARADQPDRTALRRLLREAAADVASTDSSFPRRPAHRVAPPPPPPAPATAPPDAVARSAVTPGSGSGAPVVVSAGTYGLQVVYRVRETGLYDEVPFVEEWKPLPPRLHRRAELWRTATVGRFGVGAREVTNAQFADFLAATGYRPREAHRFLAHWVAGSPPTGSGEAPVTFVDLDDARAYAGWTGGRLPTEDEWQLAAARPGWGRRRPTVWNWTESEHDDGRTRFAIIKGGSDHRAVGSDWYLDSGPQPPEVSVKLLLAGAGMMRSACVSFRCAVDLPPERPSL